MSAKGKKDNVERKRAETMCHAIGPGPNYYKLPPVVGYPKHDITRWRNPAFTIARKIERKKAGASPGPKYSIGKVDRYGKITTPTFTFNKRIVAPVKSVGPGPVAYKLPDRDPTRPRPIAAMINNRITPKDKDTGPGPGKYKPMGGVGQKNPLYPVSPAATIRSRTKVKEDTVGPGPGGYAPRPLYSASPAATITGRPKSPKKFVGPGPTYSPKYIGPKTPSFPFGVRPNPCVGTFIDKNAQD